MTVFKRVESIGLLDTNTLNVRVSYSFIQDGASVNNVADLSVPTPTTGAAMHFSSLVRQALSDYVNAKYSLTTTIVDILPFAERTNMVRVPVDFGFNPGVEETTITATQVATWVTANSVITCQPQADSFGDHDPSDVIIEGIVARAINVVPGVSFDVMCFAPEGTWGRYTINCVGN